ncbi:MAG: peptidylprolyl isomerase [Bacteroidetes bacterium]|jgi:peptidyl-prolyl cis-trans isomerase SurA|nr:peptidylprolyl isomerase [Bacteroidota bacterium]MBS1979907.1 peptidylprolyl isomerase [Bacteroidota bacterium]
MRLNKKNLRFWASSFAILLTPLLATGQTTEKKEGGFVLDKIIAKVDNYIVLKSELESAYQSFLTDGNPGSEEAKCGLLNRMVMNKVMVAKAEIDSVIVTDLEVDQNTTQRMQIILQNYGNSQEELERNYGKTFEQIKAELHDQIREQLLGREMTERITKDITITPSEVKKFYNKIPSDSLPFYSADAVIGQIVKVAKVSAQQKNEAKSKLEDLRSRFLNGENWNELAKKYSEDPSAQSNGGEMGYFGRGSMVPEYEAMAFKLTKGEVSHPFESQYGYHIMQLIDRRGNEYNSRHILLKAIPSQADIQRATFYLDSLRRKIQKDSITFEQAAKLYSDDKETKGHTGYFTDSDGGTKIAIDKTLDPAVYFVIDTLKLGSISRPLPYRTKDTQQEAVRIIYFKAKLPPHQANLKDDWHRIQSAALAEKKDKAINKWFIKSRQDVFINIDPNYKGCKIIE